MSITITPIESADDPAVEQAYQVECAARAADVPDLPAPCRESFCGALAHPSPHRLARRFLARVDEVAAGYLEVVLPELEETDNAELDLLVHPEFRRRGVGRKLFDRAISVAAQAGRDRLIGQSVAALPGGVPRTDAGAGFANSVGAKPALTDLRHRLDLAEVDETALTELLAEAWLRAEGYSLVWYRDVAPGEWVGDIAYLDGRLIKDGPLGELLLEPELIDPKRIRAGEAVSRACRRRRYNTAVRHDESERLVAFTTLELEHCPADHAWQQITIVDPEHRGHRLGTVVKIENLRYARVHEPALRYIDTWNAETNQQMIAINEKIGFRPVENWINWQIEL